MTRAGERRHVWSLFWDKSGRTLDIYRRARLGDGDIDTESVARLISGRLPAAAWHAIADNLLDLLEPNRRPKRAEQERP